MRGLAGLWRSVPLCTPAYSLARATRSTSPSLSPAVRTGRRRQPAPPVIVAGKEDSRKEKKKGAGKGKNKKYRLVMQSFDQLNATPRGLPLPPVLHAVLDPSQVKGRLIIVGDIHGCYQELVALLDRCGVATEDTVVLVGDLVNKGPLSPEVVRLARERGYYAVRGNHDDAALASYEEWRLSGGRAEVKHPWVEGLTGEDASFMHSMPFSLSIPSHGVLVVHAGLVPGVPLQSQSLSNLYKMRDLLPAVATDRPGAATSSYDAVERSGEDQAIAWGSCWPGPELVVFGHDAVRGLQEHPRALGLDTGCCYGGRLTACILPPAREGKPHDYGLVSVAALATYEQPSSREVGGLL